MQNGAAALENDERFSQGQYGVTLLSLPGTYSREMKASLCGN
jgi:hypothetical protein